MPKSWGRCNRKGRKRDAQSNEFVRKLGTLRYTLPVLPRSRFLTGEYREHLQVADVKWLSLSGAELTPGQWDDHRCAASASSTTGARGRPAFSLLWRMRHCCGYERHHDVVGFTVPAGSGNDQWSCLVDTNAPIPEELEDSPWRGISRDGAFRLLFALHARDAASRVIQQPVQESTVDVRPGSDAPAA